MTTKLAFFLSFLCFSKLSFALYGARPIQGKRFASVATLHLSEPTLPGGAFCAGVLIAKNKVLTAGHCIEGMGNKYYEDITRLIYDPHLVRVKVEGLSVAVKRITFSRTYFEFPGLDGEDLALIELAQNVVTTPATIGNVRAVNTNSKVTMVARGKEAVTSISSTELKQGHRLMFLDGTTSGVCAGDSGGGVFNANGELIGILAADTQGCEKNTGIAHFPTLNF